MLCRLVQFRKAYQPIEFTLLGMVRVVSPVHPWKVHLPILFKFQGRVTEVRQLAPSKTPAPKLVIAVNALRSRSVSSALFT